ncbi:MAG: pantoate--beta-alanine ligase [Bacteroidetes bacterium QS_7_67_15]|nr:MAG: pantoate--beta-alanine ligase [Bacteroidetes bacterium QH_8_67_23]PSQ83402.1 MAG: pantoate--beta-alanine ligase [Bacteroidetes bacterium QS_7_67_15]
MNLTHTVDAMQAEAERARCDGRRLALVPTMGALHDGHRALVRRAKREADHVTVSIFVNPTQFAPDEDLDTYPRNLDGDLETLDALGGVDAVFAPSVEDMYPLGAPTTWVEVEGLTDMLNGRYREGHFRGVTTVVTKLFNACRPHVGVFGEKDAQQLVILRRMAEELCFGVEVVGVPTQREADGLACSSRNAYLTDEERAQAPVLSEAVAEARALIAGATEEQPAEAVVRRMRNILDGAPLAEPQYVAVVDARSLQPVETLRPGDDVLAAMAVFFGDTRLIDNAFVTAGSG